METMTRQRAPIEELMLHAAQDLTDCAYERFVSGQLTQPELKSFYDILKGWTTASENVLDAANKIGIQT
jgi:hypothetical protein